MNCFDAFIKGKYIRCNSLNELNQICNYLSSKGVKWVDKDDINKESISLFKQVKFPIWLVKDVTTETLSWSEDIVCTGEKAVKSEDILSFCDLSFS